MNEDWTAMQEELAMALEPERWRSEAAVMEHYGARQRMLMEQQQRRFQALLSGATPGDELAQTMRR